MQITFQSVVKCYLVVLMVLSLLYIVDRLVAQTSKPVFVGDQFSQVVLVMKKGCVFPPHWEKL